MKKFSLFLMIVLIVGAFFISCSAEPANDSSVATVALSLDTAKGLNSTSSANALPEASGLYWFYKAEKTDSGFKTGETSLETAIWTDKNSGDHKTGLPSLIGAGSAGQDGVLFSTGNWKFSFYGYQNIYGDSDPVYKAENVAVTVSRPASGNIGGHVTIELTLVTDTRTTSVFKMEDIIANLGNAYDPDQDYVMEAYIDGVKVVNGNQNPIVTSQDSDTKTVTGSFDGILKTFSGNELGKSYIVEFKVGELAYGSIILTASRGYTTVISGSLDSIDAKYYVGIDGSTLPSAVIPSTADLTISSAAELAAFADTVNNGNTYAGKVIELSADIDLSGYENWIPIGNSARKANGVHFAGTFDGKDHTISGLTLSSVTTNLMYDANQTDANTNTKYDEYIFGLFGVVKNATICNLTLGGVNIANLYGNTERGTILTGENVGALIGYSEGSLKVYNVTVAGGSIAGSNVAGIIGRAYGTDDAKIVIVNCINTANITATNGSENKAKATGIVGFVNPQGNDASVYISNCTNLGTISSTATAHVIAAGIASYGFSDPSYNREESIIITGNTNNGSVTVDGTTNQSKGSIDTRCSKDAGTDDIKIVQN